jgi:hypothetical protein
LQISGKQRQSCVAHFCIFLEGFASLVLKRN